MKTMIKSTYLILGSVLLLSSCSQEEMPDNGTTVETDRRIVFNTSLPELSTRAEVISKNTLPYFQVIAFDPDDSDMIQEDGVLEEYVKNTTLNNDSRSGKYLSEDCIWPEPGQESDVIHFFAYYPSSGVMQNSIDETKFKLSNSSKVADNTPVLGYQIENFKVASDISKQVDFVTAYGSGSMEKHLISGVNLTFQHKLSRIEVMAKGKNKSCILEIAGVRIGKIYMEGTFNFKAEDGAGDWTIEMNQDREDAVYIYGNGDNIVVIDSLETAVSIMGVSNYAMLLPGTYNTKWDFANDNTNSNEGMYLSVLLRVIDNTNTTGNGTQQYPYLNTNQGADALKIPRVYLAVDGNRVIRANPGQLYKGDDGKYYTDSAKTIEYRAPQGSEVKEFGWAALPVTGDWKAGYSYTYTLDYTSGVGLHDPSVGTDSPRAGDPIISDRVGVSVSVNDWQGLNGSTTHTVDVPGS